MDWYFCCMAINLKPGKNKLTAHQSFAIFSLAGEFPKRNFFGIVLLSPSGPQLIVQKYKIGIQLLVNH